MLFVLACVVTAVVTAQPARAMDSRLAMEKQAGNALSDRLMEGFRNPPGSAHPWVYWFWVNGNLSKEGITADLEAMRRVGIRGVSIMEVSEGPQGPVKVFTPEWWEMVGHTLREATRVGIEIEMHNCEGWTGSGGPWITPDISMLQVVALETSLTGPQQYEGTLPHGNAQRDFYRDIVVLAFPTPENIRSVKRDQIRDITANLQSDGRLTWDVPAGNWTVLRVGYTTTGASNLPSPPGGSGLDCDKLSKEALEVHWANFMAKWLDEEKAVGASALKATHIDSWEVGGQDWTPKMPDEFRSRRGYDLLPFLAAWAGWTVDSQETTDRFRWDMRKTVNELFYENYVEHMGQLAHANGLRLSIEAYGCFAPDLPYFARADIPMSEFWVGQEPQPTSKEASSSAHVYGKPIVAAEAFTAGGVQDRWQNHPFRMKPLADQVFTLGVNRMVFHRYAAQPWLNRWPGMTMSRWGTQYERTNTWWEQSRAWVDYISRCQYLLQQGLFVADVAYVAPEREQAGWWEVPSRPDLNPVTPAGFDYDLMSAEAVLTRASVADGQIVLPDGMSYRVLVLPQGGAMTPELLRKVRDLVAEGATVVGPPPRRAQGLVGYPDADQEVQSIAAEVWGNCNGVDITEHGYGKGRVICGRPLADVLGAPADFSVLGAMVDKQVRYIHRVIDGTDFYFVASVVSQPQTFLCSFRVGNRCPELWWPDTGRMERVAIYNSSDAVTQVPIRLEPYGSVFVVFPAGSPATDERVVGLTRDGLDVTGFGAWVETDLAGKLDGLHVYSTEGGIRMEMSLPGSYELRLASGKTIDATVPQLPPSVEVKGGWDVRFPKGWGAPEQVKFDRLMSWTEHPDAGVRYFSGTATYLKRINVPKEMLADGRRLYLDLGKVQVIAEVRLNGKALGILWKPPFRVDITDVARPGSNDLEVQVTNTWANRLIGDEQLPEDCAWADDWEGKRMDTVPEWVVQGKPSPTGRFTFKTWKHWSKDDPLLESGLMGPVMLSCTAVVNIGVDR